MACTGTLPPTCSQGQSFVNDPGMTNTTEVKAHIKLRFNNQAGYPTVVARSFQVTKKKTQIQFKSLDGLFLSSFFLLSCSCSCCSCENKVKFSTFF